MKISNELDIESNKPELTEFFKSILQAMNDATRKLVEETAVNGGSLVISINGEVKKVPAKDLLAKVYGNKSTLL
jgi:hypothetical protein